MGMAFCRNSKGGMFANVRPPRTSRRWVWIVVAVVLCARAVATAAPPVFTGKFDAPSFYQLKDVYPNGGEAYCLPTSLADGVVWLSEHGYGLLPGRSDEEDIVTTLAATMGTHPLQGTAWPSAAAGMVDYLDDFYDPARIRTETPSGRPTPETFAWAQEQVARPDTIMIVLRTIYVYLPSYGWGQYVRHSLFLAGYDATDPTLHLYDPLYEVMVTPRVHVLQEQQIEPFDVFWYYTFDLPVVPPDGSEPGTLAEARWDSVMSISIAADGDANHDGRVDVLDLASLAGHYRQASDAGWADGDFDGNGRVDVMDLAIMANHYAASTGGQPVPAPSVLVMLLVAAAARPRRRRA